MTARKNDAIAATFILAGIFLPLVAVAQSTEDGQSVQTVAESEVHETTHENYLDDGPTDDPADYSASDPAKNFVTVVEAGPVSRGLSVKRLGREELQRTGAEDAAGVLGRDVSASIATGARGDRDYQVRGFDSRQVPVLLDGLPAFVSYDGRADLRMIPTEMLESMTVVTGPAPILLGPDGLGGAIHLMTRQPGTGEILGAETFVNEGPGLRFSARLSDRMGPAMWTMSGGWTRSDGWLTSGRGQDRIVRNNTDFSRGHALGTLSLALGTANTVCVTGHFIQGEFGVPPSTEEPDPRYWRFPLWRTWGVSVKHSARPSHNAIVEDTIYLRGWESIVDSFDDATYATQDTPKSFTSHYQDITAGGRIVARLTLPDALWGPTEMELALLGRHDIHENALDDAESESPMSRTVLSVGAKVSAELHPVVDLLFGGQFDVEIPDSGSVGPFLGGGPVATLGLKPAKRLKIDLTSARRTRFPTLKERYTGLDGYVIANPDLAPESAWHFGLDISWRPHRIVDVRLGAYESEVENLIGVRDRRIQNIGSARMVGLEARLLLKYRKIMTATLGYAWLHTEMTGGSEEGLAIEYRPVHKAMAQFSATPLKWLALDVDATVVGSQEFVNEWTRLRGNLGTYFVMSGALTFKPSRQIDVYLRGENLLDARFMSRYGFEEPGRNLGAGIRFRWSPG